MQLKVKVDFMENNNDWHYKRLNKDDYHKARNFICDIL